MLLFLVSNVYKEFGGSTIFRDVNFNINIQDKIGLVGSNGAGKSTLIKMILGEIDIDVNPTTKIMGTITPNKDMTIGYLSQHSVLDDTKIVFLEVFPNKELQDIYQQLYVINEKITMGEHDDELFSTLVDLTNTYQELDGYNIEASIKKTLKGLDFSEELWYKEISSLSGGQKTIISLAKILLQSPDVLILDEPTNHLDLYAIEWLEGFLRDYKKAVVLISHDTYFLDQIVNRTFEIENKKVNLYKGNYTDYQIQKEIYLSGALKAFDLEQDKIKKLEEFVLKYKAGQKSKQARGRQKLLENMDKMDNPLIKKKELRLKFTVDKESAKKVLEVNHLSKSFGEKLLFQNISFEVFKGNRIGIIGRNGVGKSTILKIILGLETANEGEVILGDNLNIGYFSQHHNDLDLSNSVLGEIYDNFDITEGEARSLCGQMLFSQDDVFKKLKTLSGGERARVAFLKLLLSKPNFMILDEPTNHLDIETKDILLDALVDYKGTMLVISHDRYFLDEIIEKIYVLETKKITEFNGNYSEYKQQISQKTVVINKPIDKSSMSSELKKEINDLERQYSKLQSNLEKLARDESKLQQEYTDAGAENNLELLVKVEAKIKKLEDNFIKLSEESDSIMALINSKKAGW